jgi:hypothetical protein
VGEEHDGGSEADAVTGGAQSAGEGMVAADETGRAPTSPEASARMPRSTEAALGSAPGVVSSPARRGPAGTASSAAAGCSRPVAGRHRAQEVARLVGVAAQVVQLLAAVALRMVEPAGEDGAHVAGAHG